MCSCELLHTTPSSRNKLNYGFLINVHTVRKRIIATRTCFHKGSLLSKSLEFRRGTHACLAERLAVTEGMKTDSLSDTMDDYYYDIDSTTVYGVLDLYYLLSAP